MTIQRILSDIIGKLTRLEKSVDDSRRLTVNNPLNAGRASLQTIAVGAISVTRPHVVVLPESGTADNLDTINNFADGKFILISTADVGDTITVRDESISGGNIALRSVTSRVLSDPEDSLLLIYKESVGFWIQAGGTPAGGSPGAHASTHQHGGADEVAIATPGANAIPKAGAGGTLASGWVALTTDDVPEGVAADRNYITDAEVIKLAGIETGADVTDNANVAAAAVAGADLGAPLDTDELVSLRGGGLGRLLISALKTAFNDLYVMLTGNQTITGEKKFTGNTGFGDTTDPIAPIHVNKTDGYESYTDSRGITGTVASLMNLIYTISTFTGTLFGLIVDTKYNLASNPATAKIGNSLTGLAVVPTGNSTTLTNLTLRGVNFQASHYGTGTLAGLIGALGFASNVQAGVVTNAIGMAPGVQNSGVGGVITNAYAIQITSFANAGTITNTYGIWVGDLSLGVQTNTPYSIYLTDENTFNYIAGKLGLGNGNTSPVAPLDVLQTALGSTIARLRSTASGDDPTLEWQQNRIATTNATPTTLHTIPIEANNTYIIEASVIARRTGGTAGTADDGAVYIKEGGYTTKAGTVTLLAGTVVQNIDREDVAAWDCALVISGTNVIVQVTGAADTNIVWHLVEFKVAKTGT